jgi:predicted ATPase
LENQDDLFDATDTSSPPRVLALRVRNYRALKSVDLRDLTPLTVLLGPNGSGKSTVFDVWDFLSECFLDGLRRAWDRRGRGAELRTRGEAGAVVIEIEYVERAAGPIITYHLAIDERASGPYVATEWMTLRATSSEKPTHLLRVDSGKGAAIPGENPSTAAPRNTVALRAADMIAASSLGQFAEYPHLAALREFIIDWHVSSLSIDNTRGQPEAGPHARLSRSGDNLANVVQYLAERHPERLERVCRVLARRVPQVERVEAEAMPDGRLLLSIKDAAFDIPIPSRFVSDGTLKMLAYLTLLHDPHPPRFIGMEEPENFLHPRLLQELAEECRAASERAQLMVTTHSPFFLDGLAPNEIRVLYRDARGHTQAQRASDIPGISDFMATGGSMGHLWMEGFLGVGDPLVAAGQPTR